MDPDLLDCISALLGRRVTAWRQAMGGYTAAERWICTLEDGQSAFAKVAVDTRTAQWLREEYHIYQHVDAVYMPRLLGWSDDHADRPILPLEDLSHAGLASTVDPAPNRTGVGADLRGRGNSCSA